MYISYMCLSKKYDVFWCCFSLARLRPQFIFTYELDLIS